ncbi:uncharacterized protein LAESUDRAFT_715017 [Laetiporus sulphureus 93-53]|uniref:Uncharacterized protein n=1 Tax=Laetiporus sulphureus 93-53 TaxID=1314785 RepID=A0A165DMN7_9APHY|nr:uncharacterized protein LAESUDRAFT_715017 [Laetiporus sulphureus 93-53]KZT05211.1 hypothetical protein LAESUDRAFT_715017 [Laetiporus sulphureus 93-53]
MSDAHAHLMIYGAKMELNFEDATSTDDRRLWLGPDVLEGLAGGLLGKTDLASRPLLAHRTLALLCVDGHALWVYPRALDITEHSGKLLGGRWTRAGEVQGEEDGEVSGVFLDAAMALVPVPPPTEAMLEERAMRGVLRDGRGGPNAESGQISVHAMAHEEHDGYWDGEFEQVEGYGDPLGSDLHLPFTGWSEQPMMNPGACLLAALLAVGDVYGALAPPRTKADIAAGGRVTGEARSWQSKTPDPVDTLEDLQACRLAPR